MEDEIVGATYLNKIRLQNGRGSERPIREDEYGREGQTNVEAVPQVVNNIVFFAQLQIKCLSDFREFERRGLSLNVSQL